MSNNVVLVRGDLFAAPPNNACNCMGRWNSGIAAAFAQKYPGAHKLYVEHCAAYSYDPSRLVGTALLIPPQPGDGEDAHWVACLFTSVADGAGVDAPEVIVKNTRYALDHLKWQVEIVEVEYEPGAEGDSGKIGEWHAAKINSVRFRTPWSETEGLLEEVGRRITVYEFEEERKKPQEEGDIPSIFGP